MILEQVIQEVTFDYYAKKFKNRRKSRDSARFDGDIPVEKKFSDGSYGLFGKNIIAHYPNHKAMSDAHNGFLLTSDRFLSTPSDRKRWVLQNKALKFVKNNKGKLAVAGGIGAATVGGALAYKHYKKKKQEKKDKESDKQ